MKKGRKILLAGLAAGAALYIALQQLYIRKMRRDAVDRLLNLSEARLIIGKHIHEVECIANEHAPELFPARKMIGKSLLYGTLMELAYMKEKGYWFGEEDDEWEKWCFYTRLKRAVDIVRDLKLVSFARDPVSGGLMATNVPTVDFSYLIDESVLTNAPPAEKDIHAKRKKRRSWNKTTGLIPPLPQP